ncbi:MAG TPA: AAA family ATPase [Clostridiaceae bacterium]|nr:AAA family ATPase [Clostridiaceae bacterium]
MFIKRVEIGRFGNLKNFTLDFKPAANLIVAPNEWGKSTLIDFIFAMFYGMDRNHADVRRSNRSRNMPWGQDSMNGALLFEAEGIDYRVTGEFGTQPRMDRIILTDEKLGKSYEIEGDDPLGRRFFGLGEHSFNQSVYVQQMSLALNVKDDQKGELLHQLASLGTAGTTEISSVAVTSHLNEAVLSLNSSRRANAVIPKLEDERLQLRDLLLAARSREEQEAEELLELRALEADVKQWEEHVLDSELKLEKTKYLMQLQDLQGRVRQEQTIKRQQEQNKEQLERVESLEPSVASDGFLNLEGEIKRLQIESAALDNEGKNLESERTAMQSQLSQAFVDSRNLGTAAAGGAGETAVADVDDTAAGTAAVEAGITATAAGASETIAVGVDGTGAAIIDEEGVTVEAEARRSGVVLSFNERRQELRRQEQTCDKELRSAYARQQQKAMNLTTAKTQLEETTVPQTETKERSYRVRGFVLTALGVILAVVLGSLWHPAAFGLALIAAPGYYFFWKSTSLASERILIDLKRTELESKLEVTRAELDEINDEVAKLEDQLSQLGQEQNDLEDEEGQIRERQQEAKLREESYRKNYDSYLERRSKFCDEIDIFMGQYPYLNTGDIVEKIKTAQKLPGRSELQYSAYKLTTTYVAGSFEVEDANRRRYENALRLFKQFGDSFFELMSHMKSLQQGKEQLREQLRILSSEQGGELLLPSQSRQLLLDKGVKQGWPANDGAVAMAIDEEDYPHDLSRSVSIRKEKLKSDQDNHYQVFSEYNKKQAHVSFAYRNTERSESIEHRLKEVEERIKKAETRLRQLGLAQKYLGEADEEMRRNFSPVLRELTAKYLDKLTLGRYDDVLIDTDMKLQLHTTGETQFREAEFMSGGCYDQVYLALRLALSELITQGESPPLILDDVLVQFDDERMQAALTLLAELSREESVRDRLGESRQVLLFSCHDIIATSAEIVGGFDIQRM